MKIKAKLIVCVYLLITCSEVIQQNRKHFFMHQTMSQNEM